MGGHPIRHLAPISTDFFDEGRMRRLPGGRAKKWLFCAIPLATSLDISVGDIA